MADISPLSDANLAELPPDFEVQIAHLSADGHDQVIEGVQDAAAHGDVAHFDVDHAVGDASEAQDHRDAVGDLHQQQADAVADGDYSHAADVSDQTVYEVQAVQDHGGDGDAQLAQAEQDQTNLHDAAYDQATAHDDTAAADYYAANGETQAADLASSQAADHQASADYHASEADQGGAYADHSYDSAASTGSEG